MKILQIHKTKSLICLLATFWSLWCVYILHVDLLWFAHFNSCLMVIINQLQNTERIYWYFFEFKIFLNVFPFKHSCFPDMHFCSMKGRCSHICKEQPPSYKCFCYDGWHLDPLDISQSACVYNQAKPPPFLIFSNLHSLR